MKDGAVVCNSGHFDIEIDLVALKAESQEVAQRRSAAGGRVQAQDRHDRVRARPRPARESRHGRRPPGERDGHELRDAGTRHRVLRQEEGQLTNKVHDVPVEIEQMVASAKLASMGIALDVLTKDQQAYLSGWEHGT